MEIQDFIDVYPSTVMGKLKFTTEARLYRGKDSFNIEFLPEDHHTPEYVQEVMEKFWKVNSMDLDHHNQKD